MDLHHICEAPITASDQTLTVIIDYIMMIIATVCLVLTLYGIYKYICVYKRTASDNSTLHTPKSLYISGVIFLITSSFTLFNALVYDILYLVCPGLDEYEAVLYHTAYFAQIYSLWIVLFLRIYFVFKNSALRLSKCVIYAYIVSFICVAMTIIPLYIIFQLKADSLITLPYITLSTIFCTLLLATFMYKLFEIFTKLGVDTFLLHTMTKHTLLSVISITWTLFVVLLLTILAIRHHGDYGTHNVMEELILEVFILLDVVSNFICVLLTYSFFDKQYKALCGGLHERFYQYLSEKVIVAIEHLSSTKSPETTKTSVIKSLETTKTEVSQVIDKVSSRRNSKSKSSRRNSKSKDGHNVFAVPLCEDEEYDNEDDIDPLSQVLVLSKTDGYSLPVSTLAPVETAQKLRLKDSQSLPVASLYSTK